MKAIGITREGAFALNSPDHVNRVVFSTAGSTAREMVVPSEASHVFFSGDCNFTVLYSTASPPNVAATYGATDASSGQAAELNPTVRFLGKGTYPAMSVISPSSGVVTAAFFKS